MTETRPWMPALMLREIAEGAPRLDADTMSHLRVVDHELRRDSQAGTGQPASFDAFIRSSPTSR